MGLWMKLWLLESCKGVEKEVVGIGGFTHVVIELIA